MIYQTAADWKNAPQKRVVLIGMSGLGKTYLSEMMSETGDWFHYSVDYRIGTRYMGEHIADNLKAEAMKVPFLRELLMQDLIHIGANVHDHDIRAVAAYLGKPGDAAKGGLVYGEYTRRQAQFRRAEIAALLDTGHFADRAQRIYGYPHFICDTGGSICEWVDPDNPEDKVLKHLTSEALLVWIKGSEAHSAELVRRFDRAPKPMSYMPEFLDRVWHEYLSNNKAQESDVDPDDFIRWTYAQALAHRQPRYAAMADKWGITIEADEVAKVRTAADFDALIADHLPRA